VTVARKDKTRSMYVTSGDTNMHAASMGDRNGAVAKVPPPLTQAVAPPTQVVLRDLSAGQAIVAAHPVVRQRCESDVIYMLFISVSLMFLLCETGQAAVQHDYCQGLCVHICLSIYLLHV